MLGELSAMAGHDQMATASHRAHPREIRAPEKSRHLQKPGLVIKKGSETLVNASFGKSSALQKTSCFVCVRKVEM